MPTIVWPGTPGEKYTNDTGQILYQLVCSWTNTCGTCGQFHLAIAKWWGKFHHGCCCISIPVYPNKESRPYEDWHGIVDALPPDQQKKLVGASNFALIEAGVVKWDDVVTSNRVRLLREVVSRSKLSLNDLTDVGIRKDIAERAHASVNTPDHILARQHRQELVKQLLDLGLPPRTIAEAIAQGLTSRIGLGGHRGGAGPGAGIPGVGPQTMPPAGRKRDEWVRLVLGMIRPPVPRPKPKPKPEPKPPTPLEVATDEARANGYPIVARDEKDAADQIVKAFLISDERVRNDPSLQNQIRKNFTRDFKGEISTDPERLEYLQKAINANYENPAYRKIVEKYGPEVIVPMKKPDPRAEARRNGVITQHYDHGKLRASETSGPPSPGDYTTSEAGGVQAVLRHEYGHRVDQLLSGADRVRIMSNFPDSETIKKDLTIYAAKNQEETFAEWFSLITDRNYSPAKVAPWIEQARQTFMAIP